MKRFRGPGPSRATTVIDRLYVAGVIVKGIDGAIELVAGLLLWCAPHIMDSILRAVSNEAGEGTGAASQFVATAVARWDDQLVRSSLAYLIAFLLVHGVVKLVLVYCLLKRFHRVYPYALAALTGFLILQGYAFVEHPTLGVGFVTLLDAVIIYLVYREYREIRPGATAEPDAPDTVLDRDQTGVTGELHEDRFVGGRDLTHWYTPVGKVIARLARNLSVRLGPHATLILTLAVGLLIAVTLSVGTALLYDSVTETDGIAGLDAPVLAFMITVRSPGLNSFATGYTDIAGPVGMPILAVAALLILALTRRSWTPVIVIAAAGAGSLAMTIAGKDLIGRNRPPLADAVAPFEFSPSFPSGHTLNAVVVVGVIAYLLILRQRSWRSRAFTVSIAAVFAFTIGLSRVYLGHHWFTDVVAGWLIGAAWLALIITAHRLYLTTRHHASIATRTSADRHRELVTQSGTVHPVMVAYSSQCTEQTASDADQRHQHPGGYARRGELTPSDRDAREADQGIGAAETAAQGKSKESANDGDGDQSHNENP